MLAQVSYISDKKANHINYSAEAEPRCEPVPCLDPSSDPPCDPKTLPMPTSKGAPASIPENPQIGTSSEEGISGRYACISYGDCCMYGMGGCCMYGMGGCYMYGMGCVGYIGCEGGC
ncbi:uncharacterized protein LOC126611072 [Malus sylvestris]|uniref:uncharacterized protein LOC126611072 n=1 Tax=Malus sylvestris TaxID=3752 RepID=UPI0021ABDA31|nr:uncharacterized protein LOC126611072 [Malus sylvestris]